MAYHEIPIEIIKRAGRVAAASSGLLSGDVLLTVNGKRVLSYDEFDEAKEINVDYLDLELKRGNEIINRVVPFDNEDKIVGFLPKRGNHENL